MKRLIMLMCGLALTTSLFGDAVTNVVKWNVPWGDSWRNRAIETLDAYETLINSTAAGTSVALASNQIFIGGSDGVAAKKTLSGDVSIDTNGATTVDTINSIIVAIVTAGAALGDTALQPITQTSGVSTSSLVATVTFQSSIAGVQHLTGWLSEAAGGVAVGTNCTSMVGADSTTVLAGGGDTIAYAVWSSKADGLSTLTVTTKAVQTGLYFNTVQSDGTVVSTPAFDVAP